MRKVLWIVLLAGLAIPMLSETASAGFRRSCGNQVYYPAPVCCAPPVYTYTVPCCGAPVILAPATVAPPMNPPSTQPPAGAGEPRPTTPPIE